MIDLLTIILLIFGILQIFLFFNVWGMTNDIKEIRDKYLKDEDERRRNEAEHDPAPKNQRRDKTNNIAGHHSPAFSFFPNT